VLLAKQKIWHSQIRECESLQETVGSLKQQLADALELRNLRPISNHSQHFSVTKGYLEPYLEKETATITSSNEKILLQQQVYIYFLVGSTLSGAIIVWTG